MNQIEVADAVFASGAGGGAKRNRDRANTERRAAMTPGGRSADTRRSNAANAARAARAEQRRVAKLTPSQRGAERRRANRAAVASAAVPTTPRKRNR